MADLSDIDRHLHVDTPDPIVRRRRSHPDGWEPGVDTAKGVIVAPPSVGETPPDDWADILAEFKLDPDRWQVDSDSVNIRTWDAAVGDGAVTRMFYFKADISPRARADQPDIDALCKQIGRHRFRHADVKQDVTSAQVVCLADWQTGGADPQQLVNYVLSLKTQLSAMLRREKPDILYVVGLGDLVEGCDGHYGMQPYQTAASGLNGRRDQVKLVRRLLVDLVTEWARHVPKMVLTAVPGNHGENRRDGQAFTTFEDNDDVAVVEQVGEVLSANEDAYGHVRTVLPDGDMSLTLDVAGTTVGFIHGHQARRGGATPRQKIENWWRGKMAGDHPIGDAQLLVSGHFHHAVLVEEGPRTWMQCPPLSRSRWWVEQGGVPSKWGTLTFAVGPDGWHSYRILR